jgi:hypothetical protein
VLTTLKSGSLNILEASAPVQVCNGIALPLPFTTFTVVTYGKQVSSLTHNYDYCPLHKPILNESQPIPQNFITTGNFTFFFYVYLLQLIFLTF